MMSSCDVLRGKHTVCLWVDDLPRLGIQLLLVAVDDTMLFWHTNSKVDIDFSFRDIHLSGEDAKPEHCHRRAVDGRQARGLLKGLMAVVVHSC